MNKIIYLKEVPLLKKILGYSIVVLGLLSFTASIVFGAIFIPSSEKSSYEKLRKCLLTLRFFISKNRQINFHSNHVNLPAPKRVPMKSYSNVS